jgi:hypothetical protein
VIIDITELDDPGFNYDTDSYCKEDANPTPTITGLAGGVFSSTTGLSIDPSTGSIDIAASTAGSYTITYTTTGVCSNSSTIDITINDLPDATITDNSPTYTANITGAIYQWIDCDTNQPILEETNQSFTATKNGSYAVDITQNGCTNRSSCLVVNTIDTQTEDTISSFKLYPNPTDGTVTVTITVQKISIFNYYGRKMLETSNSNFDISSLTSGVYFMEIETDKGRTIKKIVRR